jgi:hypothetical protein
MSAKKDTGRKAKLASALKENLVRRKAQARTKAAAKQSAAKSLGTAPQAGLEGAPEPGPNATQKRR